MDLTKDLAVVIGSLMTGAAILYTALLTVVRSNLARVFRPAVEIVVTGEELLQVDGFRLRALRLTIKNVSSVNAGIRGMRLAVVEVQSIQKSHLMTVKELVERAIRGQTDGGAIFRAECSDDAVSGQENVDPYTSLPYRWDEENTVSKLQQGKGALLMHVKAVLPREVDSVIVPYLASPTAHAVDVFFEVEVWQKSFPFFEVPSWFLLTRPRWMFFAHRCIIDLETTERSPSTPDGHPPPQRAAGSLERIGEQA